MKTFKRLSSKVIDSSFNFNCCCANVNYLLWTINLAPLVEHEAFVKAISSLPPSSLHMTFFRASLQHIFWGIAQVLRRLSRNSFLSADYTKRLTKQRSNGYGKMTRSIIAGINYACIVIGVEGTRKTRLKSNGRFVDPCKRSSRTLKTFLCAFINISSIFSSIHVWCVLLIAPFSSPDNSS